MKTHWQLALLALLVMVGCARDPFHVETHYPQAYYQQLEREDGRWMDE